MMSSDTGFQRGHASVDFLDRTPFAELNTSGATSAKSEISLDDSDAGAAQLRDVAGWPMLLWYQQIVRLSPSSKGTDARHPSNSHALETSKRRLG